MGHLIELVNTLPFRDLTLYFHFMRISQIHKFFDDCKWQKSFSDILQRKWWESCFNRDTKNLFSHLNFLYTVAMHIGVPALLALAKA